MLKAIAYATTSLFQHILGDRWFVRGAEGGVKVFCRTEAEALEWASLGFRGETVHIHYNPGYGWQHVRTVQSL